MDLTVTDVSAATEFFTDVLELPARREAGTSTMSVGCSTLRLLGAPASSGVHHLAFDVPPDAFDDHRDWLAGKVTLLRSADGSCEFEGPSAWNSRSVYFEGPDRMVLELIGRRERPRASERVPDLVSVSEVGIAVPSVAAAVHQVEVALGATVLGSASDEFAPVGDHDGLLILVRPGRGWLPVFDVEAQPRPVRVYVAGPTGSPSVRLNDVAKLLVV